MFITFNENFPKCKDITLPDDLTFPHLNWKYGPVEEVYKTGTPIVKAVIDQAPVQNKHKRILVDVKVQNLTPEQCSCLPGWHCDGPLNPLHPSQYELHHIFVLGGGPTEFIDEPVILPCEEDTSQKELIGLIPDNVKVRPIPVGAINTFTRLDFHRGVNVSKPLTRLLIRLTETDVILAKRNPTIVVDR